MKPCGYAGPDGQRGQRNKALPTLSTVPWTTQQRVAHISTRPAAMSFLRDWEREKRNKKQAKTLDRQEG